MKKTVLLNSVNKIQQFVHATNASEFDIDLLSGSNVYLDAKSLLGILSCDYSKPLVLDIHADEDESQGLLKSIEDYIVA